MAGTPLETLLQSEGITYKRQDDCLITSVAGVHQSYDMKCATFEDGARVRVCFPQVKPDLRNVKILCKELKEQIEGVEFGFYPEEQTFCLSAYVGLQKGIANDLHCLADICDNTLPLLSLVATGEIPTHQHIYLAFTSTKVMFKA